MCLRYLFSPFYVRQKRHENKLVFLPGGALPMVVFYMRSPEEWPYFPVCIILLWKALLGYDRLDGTRKIGPSYAKWNAHIFRPPPPPPPRPPPPPQMILFSCKPPIFSSWPPPPWFFNRWAFHPPPPPLNVYSNGIALMFSIPRNSYKKGNN